MMTSPTENMTVLNTRVPMDVRLRLEAAAEKIAARDLSPANVSDALRAALGRGLPMLERELGITPE